MRIEIVSISNQLLHSDILNTNAAYVTRALRELNISINCKITVGEEVALVADVLRSSLQRADVVLVIGGSGEPPECVLCQALAQVLQRPLSPEGHLADVVILSEGDWRMYGWWLEDNGRLIVGLPGDRREMAYLLETKVLPHLRRLSDEPQPEWVLLRTVGIMESSLKQQLDDLTINPVYRISYDSFAGQTAVRLSVQEGSADAAVMLANLKAAVTARLGDHIFGEDDDRLEDVVVAKLRDSRRRLALAECYTGMALTHTLDSIPGTSSFYTASLTSTATELADFLHLPPSTTDQDLSRWCRTAAERMLVEMEADLGLIVYNNMTQGGVQVLVTLASPLGVSVTQRSFGGHPSHINQWACTLGLSHLRRWLMVHA